MTDKKYPLDEHIDLLLQDLAPDVREAVLVLARALRRQDKPPMVPVRAQLHLVKKKTA